MATHHVWEHNHVLHLIVLLETRVALWKAGDTNHSKRDVIDKIWHEIQQKLKSEIDCDIPVEAIRQKWKNLREQFRKEFAKTKTTTGQGAGQNKSKWLYYEDLSFLGSQYEGRQTTGNYPSSNLSTHSTPSTSSASYTLPSLPTPSTPSSSLLPIPPTRHTLSTPQPSITAPPGLDTPLNLEEFINVEIEEAEQQEEHSYCSEPRTKKSKQEKQASTASISSQLLVIEKERLEEMRRRKEREEKEQDEHYHFLMSLLPKLRAVKPERQFDVKMGIMKVLAEEK
uniref:Uncharacterized protein n=2 Tax=Cacopsylla melanoneura TaxID=428564 RepID=A0A8D8X8I7_9HEMI